MKRARGFTMIELIVVMVLTGIVAAVAIPKLMSNNAYSALALHDQIQAAMRYAGKTAVARRRVVCANQANPYVPPVFTIAASATDNSCTVALANSIDVSVLGTSVLQTFYENLPDAMYFQPDGSITSDFAGSVPVAGAITFSFEGTSYSIKVDGVSGYVD